MGNAALPAHWLSGASSGSQTPPASSSKGSGGKKGAKVRKGPIGSDEAAGMGVGRIREVLQDVLRAASSLQGNREAEEELCREVSVAAARVLSQHCAQKFHKVLPSDASLTEETFKAQLNQEIAARLDTLQTELYKQNCFLQKVPAQVIN